MASRPRTPERRERERLALRAKRALPERRLGNSIKHGEGQPDPDDYSHPRSDVRAAP